jgi:opacity protein-like surface antigen
MEWKTSRPFSLFYFLVACPSLQASALDIVPSFPSGFTVGAGLGLTELMTNTSYNTLASTLRQTTNTKNSKYGALGNLALGYNRNYSDRYYLGGELGINILGARKITLNNTTQNSTTVTRNDTIAIINSSLSTSTQVSENTWVPVLDAKPGLFFGSNTLVFARLGMSYNAMSMKANTTYQSDGQVNDGIVPFASTSSMFYNATHQQTLGFRTGLGFEYLITHNLSLSANYIYTGYNHLQLHGAKSSNQIACDTYEGCSVNNQGQYQNDTRSKISVQDVMLQLIYHLA